MIVVAAFAVVMATVPLFGGNLNGLADLRLRLAPALFVALALQVLIIEVLPASFGPAPVLHLASYGLVVAFLVANREVPGMLVVGAGGLANLLAISANGGVMPASAHALQVAGKAGPTEHFANSAAITHAKLAFLGDIFAIPKSVPLANVFSVGDVLLVIGGAITLHTLCGSRLARRKARPEVAR